MGGGLSGTEQGWPQGWTRQAKVKLFFLITPRSSSAASPIKLLGFQTWPPEPSRSCCCSGIAAAVVQSLSRVRLSVTPWTAACEASLSCTISWSLLRLMPIELVMPSNNLILCHPLLLLPSIFPSIRVFSKESGGQSIGSSASALVLQ